MSGINVPEQNLKLKQMIDFRDVQDYKWHVIIILM